MREIGFHAVRPSAMDSDAREACGGGVEQDGSHESGRKRGHHEDVEHENVNEPLVAVQ